MQIPHHHATDFMSSVSDHYQRLLAPIYLWMVGGQERALALGAADLASLGIPAAADTTALDLGAGFGMHAIPLAKLGYRVSALDSSAALLAELERLGQGLGIRCVGGDLLNFEASVATSPGLILCMGDTLTHLASISEVEQLCSRVARVLGAGGRFVTTFRDYTRALADDARFISVRSDANRIHTCFLEESGDHIRVHDIVHERQDSDTWAMHVSHYPKLRLNPDAVVRALEKSGMDVVLGPGPRGMVQISAVRRS
jgi:SAM-dependent methyltransferase